MKETKLTILVAILITATWNVVCQQLVVDEVKEILPLRTDRVAVERILGRPLESACTSCTYQTKAARILVTYSKARCTRSSEGWDVPADTVLRFAVYPATRLLAKDDFGINRKPLSITGETVLFQDEGIAYTVDPVTREVKQVRHLPVESDNQFRCKGFPEYNPAGFLYVPTGSLSVADAFEILDGLAAQAQDAGNDVVGYVIIYRGRRMTEREYSRLYRKLERHLYVNRKVTREKVRLMSGGGRDSFQGEVFFINPGFPPPVASPDFVFP